MDAGERKTLLRNLSWSSLAMVLRIVIAGGALAMIGHLVSPAEMGFYGVGWAGAQFGYTVSLNGAAQGLIALGKVERGHIAAAQALSLAISLVVALVLVVAAPFATSFYASAHYGEAVLLGALFVPVMSLGAVDIARAQKALLFSRLAVVQTIAVLLAALTALGLALTGHGLLALFALQGGIGFWVFVLFRFHWLSPGFGRVRMAHVREIWGIGLHLSLGSLTAVVWQSIPQLVIAKVAPAGAVGLYVFCNRIVQLIFAQLNGMINNVIYPTFARLREQPVQVGRAFLETVKLTFFCLALPLLVLAAAPVAFLHVYGGGQWVAAAPILFWLAVMQLVLALGANVFPTFAALGKPSVVWRWNLFIGVVQGVGVLVLAHSGILAIVEGLAATALVMPYAVLWLSLVTRFRMRDYARNMAGVVLPLAPAIAVGRGVEMLPGLPALVTLGLAAGMACGIYVTVTVAIDAALRAKALGLVAKVMPGRVRVA